MQKDFITVTPDSGSGDATLNVVATQNTEDDRSTSFAVGSSSLQKTVTVNQTGILMLTTFSQHLVLPFDVDEPITNFDWDAKLLAPTSRMFNIAFNQKIEQSLFTVDEDNTTGLNEQWLAEKGVQFTWTSPNPSPGTGLLFSFTLHFAGGKVLKISISSL